MVVPVTRYAKSGDVHIAYQVFGSGAMTWYLCRASSRTSKTTGNIPIWLDGSFVWELSPA